MSGSIGNQTATLTVRALALGQITSGNWLEILRGEMRVSVANGAVWGGLAAFFGYALYGRLDLSAVFAGVDAVGIRRRRAVGISRLRS